MTAFSMYRGDDRRLTFALTDDDGPVDLSGADIRFTAKRRTSDEDEDAVIVKTTEEGITADDPESGVCIVAVDAADTDEIATKTKLVWDLQVTAGGKVRTLAVGTLTVLPDVSRTAP